LQDNFLGFKKYDFLVRTKHELGNFKGTKNTFNLEYYYRYFAPTW